MNENEKTRPCPSCGGVMRRGEREETLTYQEHTLTYMQPGWHCDACDDGILEDADNEVHDAALHELIARAKNAPISPLAVRVAREAVGLSQREAGRVFGGGPTAFYKYETAKAVPSESMANLLRLAIERPDLFRKPPRGKLALSSPDDAELLRRAPVNDRLNAIVRRVYPKTSSLSDLTPWRGPDRIKARFARFSRIFPHEQLPANRPPDRVPSAAVG